MVTYPRNSSANITKTYNCHVIVHKLLLIRYAKSRGIICLTHILLKIFDQFVVIRVIIFKKAYNCHVIVHKLLLIDIQNRGELYVLRPLR